MILVTGATGGVGGDVVRHLVKAGQPVRALARDPEKAAKLLPGVDVARGDLSKPDTLAPALEGATKAFLMAGAQELPAIAKDFVAAAKRAGVAHVVLLSSSTILLEPRVAIGAWHLAAEQELEASGLAWTMVRPGNFASNTLRWAPMIKAQGAVFGTGGHGKSAPIDPYDIAAVAATALATPGHEGKKYVLTGDELLSAAEQVAIIGAAIGKPLRYVEVPEAGARAGMQKAGMNEIMIDALLELLRRVDANDEALRTTTVRDVTGVAPRTFAAWVKDHVAAFT
jgi:uncharacterized protein YbjT (DUF2867 family)